MSLGSKGWIPYVDFGIQSVGCWQVKRGCNNTTFPGPNIFGKSWAAQRSTHFVLCGWCLDVLTMVVCGAWPKTHKQGFCRHGHLLEYCLCVINYWVPCKLEITEQKRIHRSNEGIIPLHMKQTHTHTHARTHGHTQAHTPHTWQGRCGVWVEIEAAKRSPSLTTQRMSAV